MTNRIIQAFSRALNDAVSHLLQYEEKLPAIFISVVMASIGLVSIDSAIAVIDISHSIGATA